MSPNADFSPEAAVECGEIRFKLIVTFFNCPFERTDSPSKPVAKRAKRDGGGSTASERSSRDPSDDSQSLRMRLIYRDKGCAVCLTAGIQEIYECREDSNRYEGSHIVGFAYHELWDTRGFSALVSDPFTDPANAKNLFASPSTRTKDLGQINSLENGMLLCLQHHRDYDNFRFAINPEGVEVKAPWDLQDVLYPPLHPAFLEIHYFTSISRAMKGSGDNCELDDDDEEELSELEEVQNEQVRIWLDGSSSGREITSSSGFMAENKGNGELSASE
ncbi:hypothetical protein PILCRDRAFT_9089 [Piloderma croceum F 1598]|uniref:HNH nuclease domain-containing protein n=1 Tax=Piloderma croceum (strain F 1598) TaxID=765440 RepID=A0A0C3B499_PILCF|nr:hypothetical protein PILCRDRAFT_9089 [Piloderma croceum F 1598]